MILDKFSLAGKVAIVTGASRGIGQKIAIALAEAGADIAGVARSQQEETKQAIEAVGRKFLAIQVDLTEKKAAEEVLKQTVSYFGKADILVNAAGIILRKNFIDFTEEEFDMVLKVNLKAVFLMSQVFARYLIENQRKGKIINIGSLLSFQGGILITPYTVSKHGVLGLTRAMANELAKYGINVNAIIPGYFETEMTAALRADPERNQKILDRIPMGRWGKPEELTGAAVFLASEASDYMTGSYIIVDGGWMSR
ncbi:2-dehydro-3-deoxy-D-gluconate 5-dehydrogenase KduD [Pseudothermotoga thermarum]|uniref:2-deoxy-D-gluconate 3-dehydrogenase n=1 Tax=Pseudothermotoga thermarum DSM 5069 TaxID=688269 RepID=F7YW39_9THEM|nr:2-dehydro-3-deoxy-D-gluconate 5-dehydrogenase KduD [Pseudothermotoga thermarum]AEH50528.1 2-deoxy-D-gluconate 3-dehydrogenase [Pseudothermotoga thermarum DSM 5069]